MFSKQESRCQLIFFQSQIDSSPVFWPWSEVRKYDTVKSELVVMDKRDSIELYSGKHHSKFQSQDIDRLLKLALDALQHKERGDPER